MTTALRRAPSMVPLPLQNIHLERARLMMPLVFGIEIIARDTIKYMACGRFSIARLREL